MNRNFILFSTQLVLLILACGSKSEPGTNATQSTGASAGISKENMLSMKINGVEWKADHDVFGAFHPKGYNKVILISGSKGPKDKREQTFNINIYNTEGPGIYNFKNGNADLSVAQLGNLTPENFLYGSMMGFNIRVNVATASTMPDVIEATFEGALTGNAGDVLTITEGKFYYHE